jgi:hypothetical protein
MPQKNLNKAPHSLRPSQYFRRHLRQTPNKKERENQSRIMGLSFGKEEMKINEKKARKSSSREFHEC